MAELKNKPRRRIGFGEILIGLIILGAIVAIVVYALTAGKKVLQLKSEHELREQIYEVVEKDVIDLDENGEPKKDAEGNDIIITVTEYVLRISKLTATGVAGEKDHGLKELGKDSRRLIVDETAPMYFVGTAEKYSPMLFIVSDNDMFGRYEQTMLMVKTLEHFGHKDGIFLEVMNSEHCKYVYKADENGDGVLANVILKHLEKLN